MFNIYKPMVPQEKECIVKTNTQSEMVKPVGEA
jgi:hypothetical protein